MMHEGKLIAREWHPRSARIGVEYDVLVHCADRDIEAKMLNVSRSGFRLRLSEAREICGEVILEMPKHEPVKAVVRWVAGVDAGGVFVESVAL